MHGQAGAVLKIDELAEYIFRSEFVFTDPGALAAPIGADAHIGAGQLQPVSVAP